MNLRSSRTTSVLGTRRGSMALSLPALTLVAMSSTASGQFCETKFDVWGASGDDYTGHLNLDGSGNLYAAGVSNSGFAGGSDDLLVICYDSAGSVIWANSWGGPDDEEIEGTAIDASGNLYAVGQTTDANGDYDAFIIKYEPSGNVAWAQLWDSSPEDTLRGVALDLGGDRVYAVGSNGAPDYDLVLMAFDLQGTFQWARTWDSVAQFVESAAACTFDAVSNHLYVTGGIGEGALVLKYDLTASSVVWARGYKIGGGDAGGSSIELSSSGDILVAGSTDASCGDFLVLRVSPVGSLLTDLGWGGTMYEDVGTLCVDGDDVYVFGETESFGAGSVDTSLMKFDNDLNLAWSKTWGGCQDDVLDICVQGGSILASGGIGTSGYEGSLQECTGTLTGPGGTWSGETGTLASFSPTVYPPPLNVVENNNPPGTTGGGGGYDALILRLDPCGLGSNYCTAVPNSTCAPAVISAIGSDVVADNDVTLLAEYLPTNQFGYFLTSKTQGLIVNPGGSQGNLCLGGLIGRYNRPGEVQNSGGGGSFTLVLDLNDTPQPGGAVTVLAGETWNFSAWFRDVNPTPTSNFTDAVSVLFQ